MARRRVEARLRGHYDVSVAELRQVFQGAAGGPPSRVETRLDRLERRLDNVVFRLGWAPSIRAARRLVEQGHVRVNGWRLNRPRYLVKVGDELTLSPRARRLPGVIEAVEHGPELRLPRYLSRAARLHGACRPAPHAGRSAVRRRRAGDRRPLRRLVSAGWRGRRRRRPGRRRP